LSRETRAHEVWSETQTVSADSAGCASLGTGLEIEAAYRHSEEWQRFRELVPIESDWRVAEMGTGNGRWLESFSPIARECVGVDYSASMLELARARVAHLSNCRLILGSVTEDVLDGAFDLIYFSGCLQYLDDDDVAKAIALIAGHLAPDGWVVDRTTVSRGARIEGTKEQRYSTYRSAEEHLLVFRRAGFELVARRKSYEALWIPLPLMVRPLRAIVTMLLRATAPFSYRIAARVSGWRWRLWPTSDERTYTHDFFVFRRAS
jgi:ubiquinone/menaquinone biosynthesis C-methylase UbiE